MFLLKSHEDMTSERGEVYRLVKRGGPIFLKEDYLFWGVDPPREHKDPEMAGDHTSTQS